MVATLAIVHKGRAKDIVLINEVFQAFRLVAGARNQRRLHLDHAIH